jgi:hypothetical protein
MSRTQLILIIFILLLALLLPYGLKSAERDKVDTKVKTEKVSSFSEG